MRKSFFGGKFLHQSRKYNTVLATCKSGNCTIFSTKKQRKDKKNHNFLLKSLLNNNKHSNFASLKTKTASVL